MNTDKEILGFKYKDIIEAVPKFKFEQCFVCQKYQAGVKCSVANCINKWHYPCGFDICLTIFEGDFKSYCRSHIPEKNRTIQFKNPKQPCFVCFDEIGNFNAVTTLIASCCAKKDDYEIRFLHKKCILQYTKNAGRDSMCILCDDYSKKTWQKDMRLKGVYIPGQDAVWERDGSFDDQVKNKCEKVDCETKYNNDVYTCYICGTEPRHLKCVGAEKHSDYLCSKCFGESFVEIVPISN